MSNEGEHASVLYNGGGTSNALQSAVSWTAYAALLTKPQVISTGRFNRIDVWLMNTTASQSCTLVTMECGATPAAATVKRVTETSVATTDQAFSTDQNAWGLTAGTDIAAKAVQRITITPGMKLVMFVSASLGGAWYARYQLLTL